MLWGGFRLAADIESIGPETQGVICALGDWFGGYALYVVDGVAQFTFARAGDTLHLEGAVALEPGRRAVAVTYRFGGDGAPGRMELLIDGAPVDDLAVDGMLPLALQHGGAGLRIGFDSGFPVSARYQPPASFSGVVHAVTIDTPGSAIVDAADEVRTALHGD
jgi:arylsulfatase